MAHARRERSCTSRRRGSELGESEAGLMQTVTHTEAAVRSVKSSEQDCYTGERLPHRTEQGSIVVDGGRDSGLTCTKSPL